MKQPIHDFLSGVVKTFSENVIVGKNFNGLSKKLYYERSQHLVFLFQRRIKYEDNIQSKVKNYLNPGDVVFDIGANIGQYAMHFSEIVGDQGKVYSFEPDFKNYAFLQFNVNINKCTNTTCHNYGVGRDDSVQEFFRDTETGGRRGSFKKIFVGDSFKGAKESVTLKSFDTIIAQFGKPNFVKVDVEGFEDEVISGLTHELENCIFLIEVRKETKQKVFEFFDKRGYECLCVDGKEQLIRKVEEIPGFANLIFRKR